MACIQAMTKLEPEEFRTNSMFFKGLPWRTSVLYEPGGLQKMQSIPHISVSPILFRPFLVPTQRSTKAYLALIRGQESSLYESVYFPGFDNLELLRSFCLTGEMPLKKFDGLVKELLKYRLLDVFAHVYEKSPEVNTIGRQSLPLLDKLVRLLHSQNRHHLESLLFREM
jgi:hypothetical protein